MKTFLLIALILGVVSCQKTPVAPPDTEKVFATGLTVPENHQFGAMHFRPKRFAGLMPAAYDVELEGGKTPLRDQGQCGSCWAFASTQTFEIGALKFGNKVIDFSEQDLVGKLFYGCSGGYGAGEHQVKVGQTDEKSCPYRASNYRCTSAVVAKATNWGYVGQPNRQPTDEELQTAILTYGSVWVTVGANNAFMNVRPNADGVITACPRSTTNHMVTLVGWKTIGGKLYFKVKNSWGTSWGTAGYAYMGRMCWNLAEDAGWLSVDSVPCQPPKVRLPKSQTLTVGDWVRLAVKPETGVSYAWFHEKEKLADGEFLDVEARESMVVTLKASSRCGEAEVISQLTVLP